ncbi:MAG TPA: hypothetical protein VGC45_10250 [Gryllotalpicola sp.]
MTAETEQFEVCQLGDRAAGGIRVQFEYQPTPNLALAVSGPPIVRTAVVHSETPVAPDGSFTVTFTVPDDFPTGQAGVTIGDGDYVPCHDGGIGRSEGVGLASCAASEVFFEVTG